ncbi:MAG: protein phosphatase 2C domain-containing protein [Planctomycetales bacterium]|nr:protein phosphatase 2C domain-containing protein [Planctomycetales bacterium]
MDAQLIQPGEAYQFLDVDMLEPQLFEVADGWAAVFSSRRPENTGSNEDAAAVISTAPDAGVLVVADGCGGMAGGAQAARLAVECLTRTIQNAHRDGEALRTAILDGVELANAEILALRTGAAATLAVVQIEDGAVRPYHIGDAQILMVGGRGKLKLLTTSHSPVGYAVEAGVLEESEAIHHEDRHLVSNVLGTSEMHVEVGAPRHMAARDGVLVASDGVLDNLLIDEAVQSLRSGSAWTAAGQIATAARQRMEAPTSHNPSKPDDLTLIVFSRRKQAFRPARQRSVSAV